MEQFPLFSILIANYNNGCYLQEAIDSVMAQNYENWEIIIVDDKSTDNSFEIYDKYKEDVRFHVYYNMENMGAGYTKHRCVEKANGEICGFLDPDDVLVGTDVFEVMVQQHMMNLRVSMVYSNMYKTDDELNIVSEWKGKDIGEGLSALEYCGWPFSHFVAFKKDFYLKTEGIDSSMLRAVDYDLYYKLEEVGRALHVDRFFYKYRSTPNSISLNENQIKAHFWHVYACGKAMKRRALRDELLLFFPLQSDFQMSFRKGYESACHTKTYKLGRFLTTPIRWIRKILKME